MARQPVIIAEGQSCDARPDGGYASLVRGVGIRTHLGDLPLPANEDLLYVRVSPRGLFEVTGQGQITGFAWLGGVAGWVPHGFASGASPCIIDRSGVLRVATPAQGSQGYRYIDADNQPVTGDATYQPFHGLSEWTDLGDGLYIGQGTASGGVLVWDGTTLRQLDVGNCRFIRAERDGEQVAVAYWSTQGSVCRWPTVTELRTLPSVVDAPPPPPPPPPPEPPKDTVDYLQIITDTRKQFGTPLGADHWKFLVLVAQRTGTLLFRKDGGTNVLIPALGVHVSSDIIGRGSMGNQYADILGDAENEARPVFSVNSPANGEYVDVSGVKVNDTVTPPPPNQPPPSQGPGAQIDQELAALLRRIAAAESKIAVLESRPQTPPSVDVRGALDGLSIALQTADDHYVTAEGGGGGAVVADRTVPESWETFRIRVR